MTRKIAFKTLIISFLLASILSTAYADELLKKLPADSLLALRVNSFEYTLSRIDTYLAGVSPVPMGTSMLVRMQLANFLGNAQLAGLNMSGNLMLFLSAAQDQPAINILVPVSDFDQLAKNSPNMGQPNDNAVYMIRSDNTDFILIKNIPGYALVRVADQPDTADFVAMAEKLSAGDFTNLAASLDPAESQKAENEPIWLYINMQQISKSFGQMLTEQLEQAKMMAQMAAAGQPGPVDEITRIDFAQMINDIKYLSLTINPEPDVLRINKTVSAAPDSETAKLLAPDSPMMQSMMTAFSAAEPAKMQEGIKEITAFIPQAENASFAGKYNMLDMIRSSMGMSPIPVKMPDLEAKSSLFYAVKLDKGFMTADIALPKLHAQELAQAAMMIQQQMMMTGMNPEDSGDSNMPPFPTDTGMKSQKTSPSARQNVAPVPNPAPVKPRTPGEPLIIKPLVGLGDVVFGTSAEQMIRILGQPKNSTGLAYNYFDEGLSIVTAADNTVDVIYLGDKTGPESPLVQNCKHITAEGIAMGSTKQDVIAAYGSPDSIYTHSDKSVETLNFENLNAKFTLKDGKVVHMVFRRP